MARKLTGRFIARNPLALAVAAALVPFAGAQAQTTASTLPNGGVVAAGTATITQPAANKLQIDQASDKAVLNWQSFSIGSGAWVNFTQPSASAIALNRVLGTNPSEIFGRLTANGQVFLSNPNGVLFAPGASVDVGGLFATTLSISDADFLAGRYSFANAGGAGAVVNQGVITATGYAALAGPQVRNDGVIVAQSGTVALAAGDRVSLDMVGDGLISISVDQAALNASAMNSGTLQADGGRVVLTARSANALLDTVVNNGGVIQANSLVARNGEIVLDGGSAGVVSSTGTLRAAGVDAGTTGGTITVSGDKVAITGGGTVDASGDSGGGSVSIGRGASATFVGSDAVIRADATRSGGGGQVETSGAYLELGSAPQVGAGGTWLIDPYNIQIVSGAGTVNDSGAPNFTPNGDSSQIGATLIVNQLNSGTNVVVDTGGAGSPGGQLGDLIVSASIVKTNVNAAGLTLNAANNLDVNAPVTLNAGAFQASAGHDMTVRSNVTASNMNVAAAGALTLDGGGVTDAQLLSSGGQAVSASSLALRAQNNRRATIQNTVGDQSVTIGAGGIDLNVVGGSGVAQIASNNPNSTTFTSGTQTVATTGSLNVVGGSTTTGSRNSGVFQNQTGKQTVTANGGITLQAANAATANAGASISTNGAQNGGGADQEINVAGGSITVAAGGIGLTNRASIVSSRDQTINGSADIIVTGGSSGTGTNAAGTNNQASISANNGIQTIAAHHITLQAGTGGTDTSASITGAVQRITATGDVTVKGGTNNGDSNGARIGASGSTTTGTDLQLTAHDVVLTGGDTDSGAAIGNSSGSVGKSNTIAITASGKVEVNAGAGNGARIGAASGDTTSGGSIRITAAGDIALNGAAHGANIRTADDATLTAANVSETASGQILVGTLALTTPGTAGLGGSNTIGKVATLSAGGTLTLNNVGTLTLDATTADAKMSSTGGQTITADGLVLHAENGHVANITNTTGDQSIVIGAGGIDMSVVNGLGVAQIVNASPRVNGVTVLTPGAQTVQTAGALNVVGGSTTTGSTNSGIFQNQSGKQTVTASSIALQAAVASVNNGGAFISNRNGGPGSDQEINVAGGFIRLTGGGLGLANQAVIQAGGNQTINGNADIFVSGGSSGTGTNATNSSNSASISANTAGKTQTLHAHDITLEAGSGGTDTFAAITSNDQTISASGDVHVKGGSNSGDSNGARIGAPGSTATGTKLSLTAHDVVLTGGTTDSGAAIGNSANSAGKPNTISIVASGKVELNGGDGNGARIGSPNGDTGGGSIDIEATGNIALNGGVHAANIRTGGTLTMRAASISEAGNTEILADSLTLTADRSADLGGANQVSLFSGTSGGAMLLNNSGPLSITNISAGGTLTLTNAGSLTLLASGTQDALVTSVGGQAVTADSISLIAQDGRRARLTNNGFGDQVVTATAGDIDLIAVNGAGTAKIVEGQPGAGGIGNQTVSAAGALNVEGGNSGGTSTGLIQSGVFQNTFGTQAVTASSISLRGSDFVANGAALITNQGGGGDQVMSVANDIRVTGGGTATGNRAGILTNGNQTIAAGGDIFIRGGTNGGGVGTDFSSNSAAIDSRGVDRWQTVSARNIVLTSGSGGIDTSATLTGFHQVIAASGNVEVNGSTGNTGSFNGARIGGPGSGATDLTLTADNVYLRANAGSGAAIGGNATSSASTNILISATHDVVLGGAPARGVRMGTAPGVAPGTGTILVSAGGNIALDGPGASTSIDTAGDVTLAAGGAISESGNAFVRGASLTTSSGTSTSLGGANRVATFNGTSGTDLLLNNTSALSVTGITSGGTLTLANAGALTMNASGMTDAVVTSVGGQSVMADSLSLHAQDGRLARLINSGGDQAISTGAGGVDLEVVNGQGSAQIVNAKGGVTSGTQDLSTTGLLNVVGGSTSNGSGAFNSGVFQAQTGKQTVTAGSISLQAAIAPVSTGGALIINTDGGPSSDQEVNVASGTIRLTGGGTGLNNRAGIQTSGNQTINGNADIFLTGGSSGSGTNALGTANSALITANTPGKTQTISAHDLTLKAGSGGTDTFAAVTSDTQAITVTGDVTITGGSNGGVANGARIGASSRSGVGTNLTLVAHNVTLTGGDTSGAVIGNTAIATTPNLVNNISISASGDVVLNSGAGNGARIGAPNGDMGAGNIGISASGKIALNPDDATHASLIRTAGDVALNAASVSEAPNGQVFAHSLFLSTSGDANLGGPNQVSLFNGTSGGDLLLNNTRALEIANLSAGGASTVSNAGPVTLTGFWNAPTVSLSTTGPGADFVVAGSLSSGGPMQLDVGGTLTLDANGPGAFPSIFTYDGPQVFNVGSLSVTARDGGSAVINQSGFGGQTINVTGGSVDVRTLEGGGSVSIGASGAQLINVVNGDHFSVDAAGGGSAFVSAFGATPADLSSQTISLTGSGRNAFTLGSAGALGFSTMTASIQSINAGAPGEQGSITVAGSPGGANLMASVSAGSSQALSTAGTLTVQADGGFAQVSGSGRQSISAQSVRVVAQGGGSAVIVNQGGDQDVAAGDGGVQLASAAGFALILNTVALPPPPLPPEFPPVPQPPLPPSNGTQTITTSGDLSLQGASALAQSQSGAQRISAANVRVRAGDAGSGQSASISSNGGGDQVIDVENGAISVTAGSGGFSNRAGINSTGNQTILGNADLLVAGGAGGTGTATPPPGSPATQNSANVGAGAGKLQTIYAHSVTVKGGDGNDTFATLTAPTQVINTTGDVTVSGGAGTGTTNGARIGGIGGDATRLTINAQNVIVAAGASTGARLGGPLGTATANFTDIHAAQDVKLNASDGGVARIGASGTALSAGDVTISAGRNIELNGAGLAASIRTSGNLALTAGGAITEATNGFVIAHGLTTTSGGSTLLGGPNQVSVFNATSTGGSVLLTNTGALEVTGLNAFGDATLDNTGNVTVSGPWTAGGTTTITVHSDLSLLNKLTSHDVFLTATSGAIQESGSGAIDAASLTTSSVGDTTLSGNNTVSTFSASSSTGGITLNNSGALTVTSLQATGAIELTNDGTLKLDTPVDTTGLLTLASHGDLTLGDSVTAGDLVVRSLGGNVTIGGADLAGSVVLHGTRSLTLEAPGQVLVRGSDCTIGAGAYALSDGVLTVNAGSFSLVGGAAPFAPAVAAGNVVNVATSGDLSLTGGRGLLSPALLLGGSNINLTVGGTLKIDGGAGDGSFARVQTATRDGEIHITFTNAAGEYVVDGLDGRIKHGQDGFYTGIKPAKPGDTFFVTYP